MLLESKYYDLSDGGKTVSVHADVLNGWGNGNYYFVVSFTDGTADKTIVVNLSGTAPEVTPTPIPTATATPAASTAPTATPRPTASGILAPAAGDTSRVVLYAVLFAALVIALIIVIILIIRRSRRDRDDY